jgi:Antitoxin Phd_YefM, type II toxin-antitoxin system
MAITSADTVPLNQAGACLADLADEVHAGSEKILTRDGEGYIALVDARRLEHYHRLEQEHIHLTLLSEASLSLDDVEAGRVSSVEELRTKYGR